MREAHLLVAIRPRDGDITLEDANEVCGPLAMIPEQEQCCEAGAECVLHRASRYYAHRYHSCRDGPLKDVPSDLLASSSGLGTFF